MRHAPIAVFDDVGAVKFANASWRALSADREAIVPHVKTAIREHREHDLDLVIDDHPYSVSICPCDDHALVCLVPADRASGQRFVEVISHELRTPLATMSLWVDVLRTASTEDMRTRALQAIADSCTAQSRLVGELLDLSRSLSGTLLIDRRSIEIAPLVREVCEAALRVATSRQVELSHAIEHELGTVIGDALRIRQILETVVETAIERAPPGGRVAVSARRTSEAMELHVRDSGSGATPEQLVMMFEPFAARSTGAFTLRLALAKHLVRLHAGTLVAYSEGIGCGTQLALRLPTENAASQIA